KERIGGSVKRKYDIPKTPCQRLIESGQLSEQAKKQISNIYLLVLYMDCNHRGALIIQQLVIM
ncbi:hypothetical protein ACFLV0_03940, partial [Chloroflexota bacterium]